MAVVVAQAPAVVVRMVEMDLITMAPQQVKIIKLVTERTGSQNLNPAQDGSQKSRKMARILFNMKKKVCLHDDPRSQKNPVVLVGEKVRGRSTITMIINELRELLRTS